MAEYCLFYTFQGDTGLTTVMLDVTNFSSLRNYFKIIYQYIGIPKIKILNKIGGKADHCFRSDSTQWDLPTKETYQQLINVFNIDKCPEFMTYEDLRLSYEDLRHTFNNQKSHHSVWEYDNADIDGHITPKPVALIENIIRHSSNKNDVVLDCFMGSGTTGVACKNLNRRFIGIEKEPEYFELANNRINHTPKGLF